MLPVDHMQLEGSSSTSSVFQLWIDLCRMQLAQGETLPNNADIQTKQNHGNCWDLQNWITLRFRSIFRSSWWEFWKVFLPPTSELVCVMPFPLPVQVVLSTLWQRFWVAADGARNGGHCNGRRHSLAELRIKSNAKQVPEKPCDLLLNDFKA